jgi:hypothetical protein
MTGATNKTQTGDVSSHRGPSLGALSVVFVSLFLASLVVVGVMTGGAHFPTPYECGAVIGVSALVMSFAMPSIGGVNQAAATTLFSLWFLFARGKAFRHIHRREIALHREWMIRAFSIGLAVATNRPIIAVFFATSPFPA